MAATNPSTKATLVTRFHLGVFSSKCPNRILPTAKIVAVIATAIHMSRECTALLSVCHSGASTRSRTLIDDKSKRRTKNAYLRHRLIASIDIDFGIVGHSGAIYSIILRADS